MIFDMMIPRKFKFVAIIESNLNSSLKLKYVHDKYPVCQLLIVVFKSNFA